MDGESEEGGSDGASDESSAGASTEERGPIPPATLEMLITTMYSQTMMSLGLMPNPSTNEVSKDLPMAKHFVDTVEMLQEKTKGNTSEEETKMFDEVLHVPADGLRASIARKLIRPLRAARI